MSTRGCYGFRKDGLDKLTYNHSDSYPECLGESIVDFIRSSSVDEMKSIFDKIVLVDSSVMPQDAELVEWKLTDKLSDYLVSKNVFNWYHFLRDYQGDLTPYKNGLKYMENYNDYIEDSLFCEWAYIINLDENILEIYKGYQTEEHENRYSTTPHEAHDGTKYYSCKMIDSYSLENISTDWVKTIMDKVNNRHVS
jgi:hypothetical protein